ncbi:hypothetical protein C483_00310 [Natrialba hulunbeirensis JCM 10989]|uniref:Type IV secretion system protein TrbL n=1 Tax=Natrialba hulunbeirensis JCM 10989 TaxID=1227493 RepID=M0AEB9_9EURY|nr:hypothetical protein [Natrialba hulunbeirensis]ELY96222.1 hypothetical protein C483_00310 [Natrialba hulunbeirensis JCM 10989]
MSSLLEFGRRWFEDIIETIIEWFQEGVVEGYHDFTESVFGTPVPETSGNFVFGTPTNDPWVGLHNALVTGEIMLLSLLLLLIFVQGHHTIRIFDFGGVYGARKARRSAWTGAFLIVTWYWIAVLILFLVNGFTIALVPDFDALREALISFLEVSISNPALALLMAAIGGIAMWILQALFFIREILLYIYLYTMPIAIAVAYGYLPVVSRIGKQIAIKFVPLAIMPLPVAILFRGYDLLFGTGAESSLAPDSSFLSYLIGASLPVFALILIWKLFAYASPLTAKAIGGATKGAVTVGATIGAAKVAGPLAAATAARWGPKAAAWQVAGQQINSRHHAPTRHSSSDHSSSGGNGGTAHDNVVTDAYGQRGVPQYRRTENDPGYY